MAPTVEVAGVPLGTRRRVIIDLALIGVVLSTVAGFFDLRASVRQQTDAFREVSQRLEALENRERQQPQLVATKSDIDRLERRIDKIETLLLSR